jgi:hypothetical protein
MKSYFKIIFIICFLSFNVKASVKDPFYDEVEGYELVEALIRDQKLELAQIELQSNRLKKSNPVKFHQLMGKFYFAKGLWDKSIAEFKLNPTELISKIYLGRNYFEIKNFKKCAQSYQNINRSIYIDPARPLSSKSTSVQPAKNVILSTSIKYEFNDGVFAESDFLKKANCEFNIKSYSESFLTLSDGHNQFNSFSLMREKIYFQLKLSLAHEALKGALNYLADQSSSAIQYLDIAEMFHQMSYTDQSVAVLEMGRVKYPTNLDLNLTLSQLYFQKNLLLAAEEGFTRSALTDGKYFYHSAELNRQLGQSERAQYFNGYVKDEKQKLKQKIATYVDSNKYNLISSLKSVIQRSELNQDDEIKYALAYSLIKVGEVEVPLKYLASIRKPELLEKTTTLQNAVLDCQVKTQSCRY